MKGNKMKTTAYGIYLQFDDNFIADFASAEAEKKIPVFVRYGKIEKEFSFFEFITKLGLLE